MFRYILFTLVVIAILFIVGMIVNSIFTTKPGKNAKPLEASAISQNTGKALLSRVADFMAQYSALGSAVQPVLLSATKIGRWFGNKEIPELLQKELDELLRVKFVHTADMCLRDVSYKKDAEILKSFDLIHRRLDNIHSLLVESDKHQLGVSNFYWESKNQQPPSVDGS